MFAVTIMAFSSIAHLLFGAVTLTFRDLWVSMSEVTTLLSGRSRSWEPQGQSGGGVLFALCVCVFGTGLMLCYVSIESVFLFI